ncbi:MAG TPA: GNAT family N-acetyltransferase [Acidimicrobiia bacterium]|nr:GNAT family N-acetyltransferase [Acidimicrobiia bacterium]
MASILTERLRLVPLNVDNAERLASVLGDAAIYEFIGGQPDSEDELRERYRWLAQAEPDSSEERWFNWVVEEASTATAIGTVQATVSGAEAEVAWIIGVEWQGQGFAKEAAGALVQWLLSRGVKTISANVHPDHAASAAVASAAGLLATGDRVDGEVVWRRQFQSAVAPLPSS